MVGNAKLLADRGLAVPGSLAEAAAHGSRIAGCNRFPRRLGRRGHGILAVADTGDPLRAAGDEPGAAGIAIAMVTGDNRRTAEAIAAQVGIGLDLIVAEVAARREGLGDHPPKSAGDRRMSSATASTTPRH